MSDYATKQFESNISDVDLAVVTMLASAVQLKDSEVTELLEVLAKRETERDSIAIDKWRLAWLLELQAKQLDWAEKVTNLEELGAEFGYPADMRSCSRYVTSDQAQHSDPLDVMNDLIITLKERLGVV